MYKNFHLYKKHSNGWSNDEIMNIFPFEKEIFYNLYLEDEQKKPKQQQNPKF